MPQFQYKSGLFKEFFFQMMRLGMRNAVWFSLSGLLLVVFLSACSQQERAAEHFHQDGGWVSSGGDMIKDASNPWWIRNTTDVNFCIAIDRATVNVDDQFVEKAFELVTDFWRKDFNDYQAFIDNAYDMVPMGSDVAQQKFHRVGCHENPDIKLVFGYGALNSEEQRRITDTDRLIARAIRTSYDRVHLKGKGLLYFASETGPRALKQDTYERPWSFAHILLLAMAHEMGHVYGIPHINGTYSPMMAESFLDALFFELESMEYRKETGKMELVQRKKMPPPPQAPRVNELELYSRAMLTGYFAPQIYLQGVGTAVELAKDSSLRKYLSLDKEDDDSITLVGHFTPAEKGKKVSEGAKYALKRMRFSAKENAYVPELVGTIDQLQLSATFTPYVQIKLTSEQEVIPNLRVAEHTSVIVAGTIDFFGPGTFHAADNSAEKRIHVQMGPLKGTQFFGDIDGRLFELTGYRHSKSF